MTILFFNIAGGVLSNVLQLLAGCLIATPVYFIFRGKPRGNGTLSRNLLIAALMSLCGLVLPLGIFGIIPLISALLAAGFGFAQVLPLLASNVVFNMLIPYNDPSFIWRTGYRQALLAFIAGLVAGIILSASKSKGTGVLRPGYLPEIRERRTRALTFLNLADESFRKLGIFLILGVAVDVLFRKYILTGAVTAVYSNSLTASLPGFFASHDVSNPFFLLTFKIAYMLMNMVILSALAAVLKPKGLAFYFGYFVIWAVILAVPAFI